MSVRAPGADISEEILQYVRVHPGCTSGDVGRALGLSRNTALPRLQTLYVNNLVGRSKSLLGDVAWHWFAAEADEEPAS